MIALAFLGVTVAGCGREAQVVDDNLWANGVLQSIVETQHYAAKPGFHLGYSEESDYLSGKDWSLFAFPFPGQTGHPTHRSQFMQKEGACYVDGFSSIAGSDLLIHQSGTLMDLQFTVFNPDARKDICQPIPIEPGLYAFNRSKTKCLVVANGATVVYDVLSARSGEPEMSARPQWTAAMMRWRETGGRVKPVLTEDAQHLVVLPKFESPGYINATNFFVEAYAVNGDKEKWSIPVTRNWEDFVDAELVDGKIIVLSILREGSLFHLSLTNMRGEAQHTGQVLTSYMISAHWDPSRHEVLCLPTQYSPIKPDPTLPVWNYESNTVQEINLHR
ncbi:MAG: hypothetical protein ACLQU4_20280 [Limisphaerales bacterium]